MQSTILKRSLSFAAALFAALALQVILTNPAHAAAIVWDGEAADNELTTATNWVGDTAPVDGDVLVFDTDTVDFSSGVTLTNASLASLDGITVQGANNGRIIITGSDLILTGDTTNTSTGIMHVTLDLNVTLGASLSATVSFGDYSSSRTLELGTYTLTMSPRSGSSYYSQQRIHSVISGSGGVIVDGDYSNFYAVNTYTGATQINSTGVLGVYYADGLGDTAGATTVAPGGKLKIFTNTNYTDLDMTISEDITFSSGASDMSAVVIDAGGMGTASSTDGVLTFDGTITLERDVEITNMSKDVEISNLVDNSNTLTQNAMSVGSLSVAGVDQGQPEMAVVTIDASDVDAALALSVPNNTKYIINGTRGTVSVFSGGILSGTGTVGLLGVLEGGILAPGLSPGCISSGDLTLAGTYEVEINGATVCTNYDQTDVTGTVDVTGGTLSILKLASYEPAEGAVFIIIKNDGADTVTGTFAGLVEGATTTVDGVEYTVSYEGGDGNDVALTVASNPDAPDTGFTSTTVNFIFIALATMLAVSGMVIAGRKLQ